MIILINYVNSHLILSHNCSAAEKSIMYNNNNCLTFIFESIDIENIVSIMHLVQVYSEDNLHVSVVYSASYLMF